MKCTIKPLARQAFAPYGWVLEPDGRQPDGFQVLVEEKERTGWRLAVNRLAARSVSRLSRHPNTLESFAVMSGAVVLVVAPPDRADAYEAFLLDKAVCIRRNVWHGSLALSASALILISENLEVASEDYSLREELTAALA